MGGNKPLIIIPIAYGRISTIVFIRHALLVKNPIYNAKDLLDILKNKKHLLTCKIYICNGCNISYYMDAHDNSALYLNASQFK